MSSNDTIDISPKNSSERRSGLTFGIVMLGLGCLFLAQSFGLSIPERWWAVFVLLPAIPYMTRSLVRFSRGEVVAGLQSLMPAIVLFAVSIALFFDFDWGHVWPIFLILAGISLLLPRSEQAGNR